MSEPLKNLAQAVIAVMGEMESLPKDGVNDFQKYSYTTEAMVANTIRPLLVKNGLALIPHNISISDQGQFEKKFRVAISATYMLLHTSGESMTVTVPGEGMDSLDKSTTKALTAAFKYAMLQMFCVGRGDDGDNGKGYEDDAPAPRVSENSAVRAAAIAAGNRGVEAASHHDPVLTFGLDKGKKLSELKNDSLMWVIGAVEKSLSDPSKSAFKSQNKALLDSCLVEKQRRAANASAPADDSIPF